MHVLWSEDGISFPAPGGNLWIGSMIETDYGLLAVGGYEDFAAGEAGLVVLTTSDRSVFERVPDPDGVFQGGGTQAPPVTLGDQIVIVGGSDWIWSPGS